MRWGRAWAGAWAGAWVCAVATVVDTVCIVAMGSPFSVDTLVSRGFPLVTVAGLVSGVMGSLVLSRHPRHPIGRLLAFAGVVTSLSVAFDAYATWVLDAGGPGPEALARVTSWLASVLNTNLPLAAFAVVVLLAPDGRLRSRRWWPVVVLAVVGAVLVELAPFVEPATYATSDPDPQSAIATSGRAWGFTLLEIAFVLALVSVVGRERRAVGVERVQTRWFSAAAAGVAATLGWLTLLRAVRPDGDIAVATLVPLATAFLVFPVLIAVAVIGYRLYDIEVIVNRAWVLLGASAFVGGAYVGLVTLAGTATADFWTAAVTAVLVAMVFQPLRVRLLRLAERLAYVDQAPPYLALADLSRRLGRSPDPERLLELLADACSHATGAAAAGADLVHGDGSVTRAAAPAGATPTSADAVVQEVRLGGVLLGRLWVQPHPGRALRRRDLLVLNGLGDQAGVAFRNLRLDDDLRRHVAELGAATQRLERTSRGLRLARADELARLQEALAHRVVPRLDAARADLEALVRGGSETGPDPLDPLDPLGALDALDALKPIDPLDPLDPLDPAWARVAGELTVAQAELRTLSHGLRTTATAPPA